MQNLKAKILKIWKAGLLFFVLYGSNVFAQAGGSSSAGDLGKKVSGNLNTFGKQTFGSQANTELPTIIAEIINWILGFLGILLVIYLVYGGFKWMTAEGESSKVDEAKQIIKNAIIGLIIIFASYAIANFVVDALVQSTI